MALSRVTTWSAGQTLTAAALNAEFDNIINGAASLINGVAGSFTTVAASGNSTMTQLTLSGALIKSVTNTITAGSTQTQAGATALTKDINRVTVSGTDGDGVALPAAVAGAKIEIINDDSAQTIQIWPASGDAIDGGSANAVDANALAAGGDRTYFSVDATNWYTKSSDEPAASATVSGIVELATDAETITGTDTARAVTPANIQAKVAGATVKGIVELATDAETITGTDTARAVTPANIQAKVAGAAAKGIVELATTAETTTGTDAARAVTPDGLHDMTSLSGAVWMLDENDMATDSDTKVASQQSIKAYVDALGVTSSGSPTFTGLTTTGHTQRSLETSITAGTTQTMAGAAALTKDINIVTAVGSDDDGVALPTAVAGKEVTIINSDAAQRLQIWPGNGFSDTIDGGSANAVDANKLAAGGVRTYTADGATNWVTATNPSISTPVSVANGGTGATSLTAAQIAAGGAATSGLTAGATIAGGVTAAQAVAVTQGLAIAAGGTAGMAMAGASYLGMGLLLGGASLLLAPDVPSGDNAEQAENYLFSGPINTVKQGQPIPLVYGRMVTGSKTIMGSLFTETSRDKISKSRKLVGIGGFREDGSTFGNTAPAGRTTKWWYNPDNEMGR